MSRTGVHSVSSVPSVKSPLARNGAARQPSFSSLLWVECLSAEHLSMFVSGMAVASLRFILSSAPSNSEGSLRALLPLCQAAAESPHGNSWAKTPLNTDTHCRMVQHALEIFSDVCKSDAWKNSTIAFTFATHPSLLVRGLQGMPSFRFPCLGPRFRALHQSVVASDVDCLPPALLATRVQNLAVLFSVLDAMMEAGAEASAFTHCFHDLHEEDKRALRRNVESMFDEVAGAHLAGNLQLRPQGAATKEAASPRDAQDFTLAVNNCALLRDMVQRQGDAVPVQQGGASLGDGIGLVALASVVLGDAVAILEQDSIIPSTLGQARRMLTRFQRQAQGLDLHLLTFEAAASAFRSHGGLVPEQTGPAVATAAAIHSLLLRAEAPHEAESIFGHLAADVERDRIFFWDCHDDFQRLLGPPGAEVGRSAARVLEQCRLHDLFSVPRDVDSTFSLISRRPPTPPTPAMTSADDVALDETMGDAARTAEEGIMAADGPLFDADLDVDMDRYLQQDLPLHDLATGVDPLFNGTASEVCASLTQALLGRMGDGEVPSALELGQLRRIINVFLVRRSVAMAGVVTLLSFGAKLNRSTANTLFASLMRASAQL